MFKLPHVKEKIIEICTKRWPSYCSIFISSSKQINGKEDETNKFDILLIDPQFSAISVTRQYIGNLILNWILAPLNNI